MWRHDALPDKLNGEQPLRKRQGEGSIPSSGSVCFLLRYSSSLYEV